MSFHFTQFCAFIAYLIVLWITVCGLLVQKYTFFQWRKGLWAFFIRHTHIFNLDKCFFLCFFFPKNYFRTFVV